METSAIVTSTEVVTENVENIVNQDFTSQVEQYTQLIHTYGASAVIISVFLILLFLIVLYILKNNQKTNNQLIKQQQELVDMLLSKKNETVVEQQQQQQKDNTKIKETDIVEVFLNINSSIKEILKDISDDVDASRLAIYVFHNGVYSSHGLPFFKTSCICEFIKKNSGVTKNINTHCGLPLQMFDDSISTLYKNGRMSIVDVDDDENELVHDVPVIIGMLKSNNIKSGSGVAIYDHDDNILGVIIAEFVEKRESLEEVERLLINKAPLLSPILEYSGIYNNGDK